VASSHGILIFLSILASDADAIRRFYVVAARPSHWWSLVEAILGAYPLGLKEH
jgi:hypothetical protein